MLKHYGKLCFTVYMLRILHLQDTEFNASVIYIGYNISHVSFCIYLLLFPKMWLLLTFVLNSLRLIWFRVPTFFLFSNLLCGVASH